VTSIELLVQAKKCAETALRVMDEAISLRPVGYWEIDSEAAAT